VVSGGHTLLVGSKGIEPSDFNVIGQSLDDNVGEAFDKVWRLLLEFLETSPDVSEAQLVEWTSSHPGAALEKLAGQNTRRGFETLFAIPMQMKPKQRQSFDFSFSGLKAAVARQISKHALTSVEDAAFIAAAFQHTAIEHLALTTEKALRKLTELQKGKRMELVVSGGVAANQKLQQRLKGLTEVKRLVVPPNHQCVDNGVMIAWNGLLRMEAGHQPEDLDSLRFDPRWPVKGKRGFVNKKN
jgi:N6-L-threonylcarbamoyladenine synthase